MSTTTMHDGSNAIAGSREARRRPAQAPELAGHQIRRLALGAALLSWGGIFLFFKLV